MDTHTKCCDPSTVDSVFFQGFVHRFIGGLKFMVRFQWNIGQKGYKIGIQKYVFECMMEVVILLSIHP